jgi:HEPN domain-containing protein
LAEAAGLLAEMDPEDLRRLDFLSQYYLNARYKEDLQDLTKQVGEEVAQQFLAFTRRKMQWCTRGMRPAE